MLKEGLGVKKIILRAGKTDLRHGIDGLAAIVKLVYGMDPLEEGTLFLFCGIRRDRIKGLLYEGDGFLLLTKRLSNGVYQWPRNSNEAKELSREAFSRLICLWSDHCKTHLMHEYLTCSDPIVYPILFLNVI